MGRALRPHEADPFEVGRRAHSRLRVGLPARLTSIFGTQQVQLLDVSRGGLKLQWSEPLRPDRDVVIDGPEFQLFGMVAWSEPKLGGISLDVSLSEQFVAALRKSIDVAPAEPHRDGSMFALRNWQRTGGRY
jgi:hypothetical protein